MRTTASARTAKTLQPEARLIDLKPYYEPIGDEIALFEAATASLIPVLLKGPTGCGKTRFMEYVAWKLQRPLITVSCHDDLTASDLVGRYLYPKPELEREIVRHESGVNDSIAAKLVKFAGMTRNLKGSGLDEGASTRLLVHAGKLIASDIAPRVACRSAIAEALTDDAEMLTAVNELGASLF